MRERQNIIHKWTFHSGNLYETPNGTVVVDDCYSKTFGGILNRITVYIFPNGQILGSTNQITQALYKKAFREARIMMPTLKNKLISGNS
jgi:hypothetical protein